MKKLLLSLAFCFALTVKALSQTSDTGIPPFLPEASFGSIDTINEANLNIHLTIPVITKAGSPPFSYALTSDTGSGPFHFEGYGHNEWGGPSASNADILNNDNKFPGYFQVMGEMNTAGSMTWTDPSNTVHSFPGAGNTATDGSGYTLTYNSTTGVYTVYDKAGNQFIPGTSLADSNGNSITWTGPQYTWDAGPNSFSDSLGQNVLNITPAGPSTTYAYTGPNGTIQTLKVNVSTHSVSSNFGCSPVTEYSNVSWDLVDSVNLPDGTSYTFSYLTDGRLSQINLPTGGWIKYTSIRRFRDSPTRGRRTMLMATS